MPFGGWSTGGYDSDFADRGRKKTGKPHRDRAKNKAQRCARKKNRR